MELEGMIIIIVCSLYSKLAQIQFSLVSCSRSEIFIRLLPLSDL